MSVTSHRILIQTITFALTLVLAVALTLPATAAPKSGKGGGNGNGGGGNRTTTTATIDAEQLADGDLHFWGCGYDATTQVNFVIDTGTSTWFFYAGADDAGCVDFVRWSQGAGHYEIETYQNLKGNKQTLMASTVLEVS